MSKKNKKKENGALINLVEGTRRRVFGILSDESNTTTWKDTLVLILVLILAFFLYSLFES